jgi:hypothetical protein
MIKLAMFAAATATATATATTGAHRIGGDLAVEWTVGRWVTTCIWWEPLNTIGNIGKMGVIYIYIIYIYMGYMPSYEDLWGLSLCFCRGQNVLFKPLECVRNNLWDCKMKKQLWWWCVLIECPMHLEFKSWFPLFLREIAIFGYQLVNESQQSGRSCKQGVLHIWYY